MKTQHPNVTSIKSFDFSTPYTTIPHQKLKNSKRLTSIIRTAFQNCNRRYKHLVLGHEETYFVKEHSDSKDKYFGDDIIQMLEFLVDNIFVVFAGKVSQQTVGIPMGTNCAPLLADIFSYEAEFIQPLLSTGKQLAYRFNLTTSTSMMHCPFESYLGHKYPAELKIKDTTESITSASYLDLLLSINDKRDDFNFHITNFPFPSLRRPMTVLSLSFYDMPELATRMKGTTFTFDFLQSHVAISVNFAHIDKNLVPINKGKFILFEYQHLLAAHP